MLHDTTPGAKESGFAAPWLPGVVAWKLGTCFTFIFGFAIICSLVPCSFVIDGNSFDVARSQAIANPAVVSGASEFLSAAAAGAGLSESEFVASVVGAASAGTGLSLANSYGIRMGNSLSDNLRALIDAADYPDYDTLDNSTKEAWGSREYYETAKFNSLCDAFGLGDARQRFYTSGGSNVDFTSEELGILGHIGALGETWKNRGANAIESIRDLLTQSELIPEYFGANAGTFDGSQFSEWPTSIPSVVTLGRGTGFRTNSKVDGRFYAGMYTDRDVLYFITCTTSGTKYVDLTLSTFDKQSFMYATSLSENRPTNISSTSGSTNSTVNGETVTFSYALTRQGGQWTDYSGNMPVNVLSSTPSMSDIYQAEAIILYGGTNPTWGVEQMEYYPEDEQDIPDTQEIYYPEVINNVTNWNNFITEPEQPPTPVQRPDNPYNPDNQSGTQEWRDETTENLQPLLNIHVEQLFPFCLYWDMKELWSKVVAITGMEVSENGNGMLHVQSVEDYNHVVIPIVAGDIDEEISFNLEPLHDIGVMVRPFALVTLIIIELTSVLWFWKGILTGS